MVTTHCDFLVSWKCPNPWNIFQMFPRNGNKTTEEHSWLVLCNIAFPDGWKKSHEIFPNSLPTCVKHYYGMDLSLHQPYCMTWTENYEEDKKRPVALNCRVGYRKGLFWDFSQEILLNELYYLKPISVFSVLITNNQINFKVVKPTVGNK